MPRDLWWGVLGVCAVVVGCGNGSSIPLDPDLEFPVYLGPARPIGGGTFQRTPVDEDFAYEHSRAGGETQEGREYLVPGTCVEEAVLYTGRYDGILFFVPVSNLWVGVEGEVVQVAPSAAAEGPR